MEMQSGINRKSIPLRTFSLTLAVLTGALLWWLTVALSDGITPLGKVGPQEKWLFAIPLLLFSLPIATWWLWRGRTLRALWVAALTPLTGLANMLLALGLLLSHHPSVENAGQRTTLLSGLWVTLTLIIFAASILRSRSDSNTTDAASELDA